jgi:hypothetical protein
MFKRLANSVHVVNELTLHSNSTIEVYGKILDVFYPDPRPRTWKEVFKESGLKKTRFSILFRELVRQGVIEGSAHVDISGKLATLYVWNVDKVLVFNRGEGDDVLRVHLDKHRNVVKCEEMGLRKHPYDKRAKVAYRRQPT